MVEVAGAPTRARLCDAIDALLASGALVAPLSPSERCVVAHLTRSGARGSWDGLTFLRGGATADYNSARYVAGEVRVRHEVCEPGMKLLESEAGFDPVRRESLYVAYRVDSATKPLALLRLRALTEATGRTAGKQKKYAGDTVVSHASEPAEGVPLLVTLDDELHLFGGGQAEAAVQEKLLAALRPFLADGNAASLGGVTLRHMRSFAGSRVAWSTYPDRDNATGVLYGRRSWRASVYQDESHPEQEFVVPVGDTRAAALYGHNSGAAAAAPARGGELFIKVGLLLRCPRRGPGPLLVFFLFWSSSVPVWCVASGSSSQLSKTHIDRCLSAPVRAQPIAAEWAEAELEALLPKLGDFDVDAAHAARLRDRAWVLDEAWEKAREGGGGGEAVGTRRHSVGAT